MRKQVKEFFEESNQYLEGNSTILVRKKVIEKFLVNKKFDKILDLGCGDGSLSLPLIQHCQSMTLVDFSRDMIHLVKERIENTDSSAKIELVNSSIEDFHSDEKFDLILLFGVLAHVENIDEIIEKCNTLLDVEGSLFVQNSNAHNLIAKFNLWITNVSRKRKYSVNSFSDTYITQSFKEKGFNMVSKHHYLCNTFGLRRISPNADLNLKLTLAQKNVLSPLLPDVVYEFKKSKNY